MAKPRGGPADAPNPPALTAFERILAAMFVGIIVLTVVAFVVLMAGSFGGWLAGGQYEAILLGIVLIALPIALVLMIVLTITIAVRRSREQRKR